ncbi:hypothetical protein ACKF11_13135 [Methylobacillus sp. Pita2]|uniref:hypothetical protein n=1 Tax=Methylobacillus sp. Pita2 TaxID=3383245 RepID=UPI0038B41D8F
MSKPQLTRESLEKLMILSAEKASLPLISDLLDAGAPANVSVLVGGKFTNLIAYLGQKVGPDALPIIEKMVKAGGDPLFSDHEGQGPLRLLDIYRAIHHANANRVIQGLVDLGTTFYDVDLSHLNASEPLVTQKVIPLHYFVDTVLHGAVLGEDNEDQGDEFGKAYLDWVDSLPAEEKLSMWMTPNDHGFSAIEILYKTLTQLNHLAPVTGSAFYVINRAVQMGVPIDKPFQFICQPSADPATILEMLETRSRNPGVLSARLATLVASAQGKHQLEKKSTLRRM